MTAPVHDTIVLPCVVRISFFTCFILLFFLSTNARTQESPPISKEQVEADRAETASAPEQVTASDPGHQEEHPRLFWVVPTYSVTNSKLRSGLSAHEKFRIFAKNALDPFTVGYIAMDAGIGHANNDLSGYGQGTAGYAKRLGAGLANETSASFFRTYVFSSLLHQDPRYFRRGSGPFKNRLIYAMIRPLVTQKDSGGHAFNWSGLLGNIAASSLSNAYYPVGDRGLRPTFERVAFSIPSGVIDHLIDEFGPDLESRFLRKK